LFESFIERPVFNLLELIYALVPGHDLGLAIILFTIVIRILLWPLVKKQLHQSAAMRKLQPQLRKLKKSANGDRQKEARLQMELYKEHGVKPFATVGTLIIQLPIFLALYYAIRKLINDPNSLQTFSFESVRNLPWIQELSKDISKFEHTLYGAVDLSHRAIQDGGVYLPAIILGLIAAAAQFYQSKLMMPDAKDARKLSVIFKEAAAGKQTDQAEMGASISRNMMYFMPFATFLFSVTVPPALTLYILTSSAVGYFQHRFVLKKDEEELHEIASEPEAKTINASAKPKKTKKPSAKKKRRK